MNRVNKREVSAVDRIQAVKSSRVSCNVRRSNGSAYILPVLAAEAFDPRRIQHSGGDGHGDSALKCPVFSILNNSTASSISHTHIKRAMSEFRTCQYRQWFPIRFVAVIITTPLVLLDPSLALSIFAFYRSGSSSSGRGWLAASSISLLYCRRRASST